MVSKLLSNIYVIKGHQKILLKNTKLPRRGVKKRHRMKGRPAAASDDTENCKTQINVEHAVISKTLQFFI